MDNSTNLTFGNTAYVSGCGDSMIDAIEKSGLLISMKGDGLVAMTYEALTKYIMGPKQEDQDDTYRFLDYSRNLINTYKRRRKVAEIVFRK